MPRRRLICCRATDVAAIFFDIFRRFTQRDTATLSSRDAMPMLMRCARRQRACHCRFRLSSPANGNTMSPFLLFYHACLPLISRLHPLLPSPLISFLLPAFWLAAMIFHFFSLICFLLSLLSCYVYDGFSVAMLPRCLCFGMPPCFAMLRFCCRL